jgi:hypothetical protein
MSRQNRTIARDRKSVEPKRDVASSNDRFSRNNRDESRNERDRGGISFLNHLDSYRLNDLYERSSI